MRLQMLGNGRQTTLGECLLSSTVYCYQQWGSVDKHVPCQAWKISLHPIMFQTSLPVLEVGSARHTLSVHSHFILTTHPHCAVMLHGRHNTCSPIMPLARFGLHSRVDQANRPIYFLLDMERVRVYYNACLMCGIHLFTCCDVLFSTRYAFAAILKSLYTLAKLVGVLHL